MDITERQQLFRTHVTTHFLAVCNTGDVQGLHALLSDIETATELGRDDTIEFEAVRAAFKNYDQSIGILGEIMRVYSRSRLSSIFEQILIHTVRDPAFWGAPPVVARYFLGHLRTLGFQPSARDLLLRALEKRAWPVLPEIQRETDLHVLLAYLTSNAEDEVRDRMPQDVRRILIHNASLEELVQIRTRFAGDERISAGKTYAAAVEQEPIRRQRHDLAWAMMSHPRLAKDSSVWGREAMHNGDLVSTIKKFIP